MQVGAGIRCGVRCQREKWVRHFNKRWKKPKNVAHTYSKKSQSEASKVVEKVSTEKTAL